MRCDELSRVLSLKDARLRCAPVDLAAHMETCPVCRERHPEIAWLVGRRGLRVLVPPAPRRPARAAGRLAAASALVAALLVPSLLSGGGHQEARPAPSAGAAAHDIRGTLVESTVTIQRGRPITTTYVRRTWSPPRPRILGERDS